MREVHIRRAYAALLRLYPRDHRALFAAEMLTVFEEAAEDLRGHGRAVFVRFALAELIGLVTGAGAAWIAKLTGAGHFSNSYIEAGAYGNARQSTLPDEVIDAQRRIEFNISRTVYAISHHDFAGARFYSNEERKQREHLRLLREKYRFDE